MKKEFLFLIAALHVSVVSATPDFVYTGITSSEKVGVSVVNNEHSTECKNSSQIIITAPKEMDNSGFFDSTLTVLQENEILLRTKLFFDLDNQTDLYHFQFCIEASLVEDVQVIMRYKNKENTDSIIVIRNISESVDL